MSRILQSFGEGRGGGGREIQRRNAAHQRQGWMHANVRRAKKEGAPDAPAARAAFKPRGWMVLVDAYRALNGAG